MKELPKCTKCGLGLSLSVTCPCGSDEKMEFIREGDDLKTETVTLNLGLLQLKLLDKEGKELRPGEEVECHRFEVRGPGVHPLFVRRVEFTLDYSKTEMAVARVEQYVVERVGGKG